LEIEGVLLDTSEEPNFAAKIRDPQEEKKGVVADTCPLSWFNPGWRTKPSSDAPLPPKVFWSKPPSHLGPLLFASLETVPS